MDVDYNLEDSSLSGILANFSAPATATLPPLSNFRSSSAPSSSWRPASTSPPHVGMASSAGPSSVEGPVSSLTNTVLSSGPQEDGQQRLVASLEEATRIFKEVARPAPPVIVINQLPPSSPAPAWHEDSDLAVIGGGVAIVLLIMLVAVCFWLKKFRPDSWKKVKTGARRLLKWVALPLSWVCGRAAAFLQYLHVSAEDQHVASANPVQVSKTEFL